MKTRDRKKRFQRAKRVRASLVASRGKTLPRLSVFRSNQYFYAQLIDDVRGKTLASVSSKKEKVTGKALGGKMAMRAKEKNISRVVFDRGSYRYHGTILAFAEGAREGGLQF